MVEAVKVIKSVDSYSGIFSNSKGGVPGFMNGTGTSELPDTGSTYINALDSLEKGSLAGTKKTISKVKRGLSGFVNGTRATALPDTGSTRNVVSEAFAKEMQLEIKGSPSKFVLGNSRMIESLGELLPPSLVHLSYNWLQ